MKRTRSQQFFLGTEQEEKPNNSSTKPKYSENSTQDSDATKKPRPVVQASSSRKNPRAEVASSETTLADKESNKSRRRNNFLNPHQNQVDPASSLHALLTYTLSSSKADDSDTYSDWEDELVESVVSMKFS